MDSLSVYTPLSNHVHLYVREHGVDSKNTKKKHIINRNTLLYKTLSLEKLELQTQRVWARHVRKGKWRLRKTTV